MIGLRHQAAAIARRDLLSEMRSGEVLWVIAPFAAIALLLIPLGIGTDVPTLRRIGPGLYWAVVLLFGILVALRQSADNAGPQRDRLAMLGADPAAVLAGRAAAAAVLLIALEVVLLPVMLALYDAPIAGWGWLLALVPLVGAALAMLGTLVSAVTGPSATRPALVPLLVAPLAIPILLAATQALEGLRLGESILTWLLLLLTVNLALAVTGVLVARPLQEAG
ncbi:MAG: heme exporter protein CcmB [Acidimicrobiia bacterium]